MAPGNLKKLEIKNHKVFIPERDVVCVHSDNNLEHALLVLTKSGYSSIPVIDRESRVVGTIGLSQITNKMIESGQLDSDNLRSHSVADAVVTNAPSLLVGDSLWSAFNLLILHPYLCIQDDDAKFVGILPRSLFLKILAKFFDK